MQLSVCRCRTGVEHPADDDDDDMALMDGLGDDGQRVDCVRYQLVTVGRLRHVNHASCRVDTLGGRACALNGDKQSTHALVRPLSGDWGQLAARRRRINKHTFCSVNIAVSTPAGMLVSWQTDALIKHRPCYLTFIRFIWLLLTIIVICKFKTDIKFESWSIEQLSTVYEFQLL